jgi:hypothetical protein
LTKDGWKAPPTANLFYAAATTANCRRRLVKAALRDPHSVVAFMTDGIVTDRKLEGLPNVINEGEESRLGDWEYAPVDGGTFLHAGVYSMRKAGKELTKTRGVDPKRVSADDNAGKLLVSKAVEAMSREYDPPSISQSAILSPSVRRSWHAKKDATCGRRASPVDGLRQSIVNMRSSARSTWTSWERNDVGYPAARMIGRRVVARTEACD